MALNAEVERTTRRETESPPTRWMGLRLLQCNNIDLLEKIGEEVIENPALERVAGEPPLSEGERALMDVAARLQEDEIDRRHGVVDVLDWEWMSRGATAGRQDPMVADSLSREWPALEGALANPNSLTDHLLEQLRLMRLSEGVRTATKALVHNLDDRGWLIIDEVAQPAELDEIAMRLDVAVDDLEVALCVVQRLDPLGCGARSLEECLAVQAAVYYPEDLWFQQIIHSHLNDLERRRYGVVGRRLGLHEDDVVEYHRMIQELEPHPGRGFANEPVHYIVPDLCVVRRGDEWEVQVDDHHVPDLRVNPAYQRAEAILTPRDREFVNERVRSARGFIDSLARRRHILVQVMNKIVEHQDAFFDRGPAYLRPLTLQQVADALPSADESRGGVHTSTVSRAAANKHVHTVHGIYELKYFFTAGVRQSAGHSASNEVIKQHIRALVRTEDSRRPYSDQRIADLLEKRGVRVARRTVTKYRKALRILPSFRRKNVL